MLNFETEDDNSKNKGLIKWINRIIQMGWTCRLTLKDRTTIIGIPTLLSENKELTLYPTDYLDEEDEILGIFSLKDIALIETYENRAHLLY
ncbi:MAG: hypothetical protein N4A40_12885 [Tissierellales bacterium]|jgi:hypothetical protein|nr:hypothetical protein [Tissierellales bacterium]